MKLYTDPTAPNPMRLSYFMAYKSIEVETELVSLRGGSNFTSEFEKINPMRTVPCLALPDSSVLTDTIAICVYLERLFPSRPLFGETDMEFAQILGWCHRNYSYGVEAVSEMFRNQGEFFKDRALPLKTPIKQNPDLIARGNLRVDDYYNELETHLTGKTYIVTDKLTQADIDTLVTCHIANWVKKPIPETHVAIRKWFGVVKNELPELKR